MTGDKWLRGGSLSTASTNRKWDLRTITNCREHTMIHQPHESNRTHSHSPPHTAVPRHGAPSEAGTAAIGKDTRMVFRNRKPVGMNLLWGG